MSLFGQLKALSIQEWKTLLASLWLLPFTAVLLKLRGVQKTRQLLGRLGSFLPGTKVTGYGALEEARCIARMVSIVAGRGIYRADCLKKSIVIELLLKRRGIECELKFGTRVGQGFFGAHAWVEARGEALADPGSETSAIEVFS